MGPENQAAGTEEVSAKRLVFLDYMQGLCFHLWKYPVSEIKVFSVHILIGARCLDRDSKKEGKRDCGVKITV